MAFFTPFKLKILGPYPIRTDNRQGRNEEYIFQSFSRDFPTSIADDPFLTLRKMAVKVELRDTSKWSKRGFNDFLL